jgi:hypothetical protein
LASLAGDGESNECSQCHLVDSQKRQLKLTLFDRRVAFDHEKQPLAATPAPRQRAAMPCRIGRCSSSRWPDPLSVLELLKPVTWFAPMWAFACGVISSGVGITQSWTFAFCSALCLSGHFGLWHEPGDQ